MGTYNAGGLQPQLQEPRKENWNVETEMKGSFLKRKNKLTLEDTPTYWWFEIIISQGVIHKLARILYKKLYGLLDVVLLMCVH
jgi:hypothetical protein